MKFIPLVVIAILLTGVFTSSCRHYPTTPPTDSTKCDTCDTDTTHHPCDTCNIDKDSLAHAFEWTEYTIPGETNLTGCWIFNPTDIRIMGNYFYKFDGTTFTKLSAYNLTRGKEMGGGLNGYNIFGFDDNDYWLISGNGSRAYHSAYDTQFDEFNPGNTNACWGTSSNDMFIVGNSGQIHHYDGTKFTDMVSGTTKDLRSIWGTGHNDVWAGGFDGQTGKSALVHFDGTTWTDIDLATVGKFECAGCDGISSVWAVDSLNHHLGYAGGSLFYRKTDNSSWTNDSNRVGNKINDANYVGISIIRGNNASDILCAGDWGLASHWNGKTWKRYDILYNPQNSNYATNAMDFKGNTACIVGFKDGQSWVAIGRRKP